ncbi:SGNH/GDSL hydrolase family protein [Planococcus salinus]|uniref:SGNH/GDSL hydrolase family protein n=2 Tax=Planococcus salinus TaxID=1848460 RepID=A0A3M8P5H4_9BACL|nr:SGNH/GDSL hydrolase family protein [Planococcus salinus]
MSGIAISAHAEVKAPAAYVGLGDSLAAGQTPASEIDTGYVDLIAQELMRNQPLAFYTKDLAFPGFTTEDVLERVKSEEAQELLTAANIITVSAGANDLLRLVQTDPMQGSLAFNQIQVNFALDQARSNMEAILQELKERAPCADIYVMGYYFAYPHMRVSQKAGIAEQLDLLNEILERTADKAGVHFVPVDSFFGYDAVDKLPNPADVHPNIEGYRAMANAFFTIYQDAWEVAREELPEPNPLTFEEIMQAREQNEDTPAQDGRSEEKERDNHAFRPSDQVKTDYLALREAIPYI